MGKRTKKFSGDYDDQERSELSTGEGDHPKFDTLSSLSPVAKPCKEPYASYKGLRVEYACWPADGLPSWLKE